MTPQPCRRIAIIQEMESPGRLLQTRTVIGLLPYDKEECDRMMRFIPEQYAASRPAPSPDDEVCRYWGKKDGKPVCSLLIPDPALYVELVSADHKVACKQAAAQTREKLFEAIRAERDPHLDYVDWDSIEAAYIRTEGGDE